jgi:hypothetical protein
VEITPGGPSVPSSKNRDLIAEAGARAGVVELRGRDHQATPGGEVRRIAGLELHGRSALVLHGIVRS